MGGWCFTKNDKVQLAAALSRLRTAWRLRRRLATRASYNEANDEWVLTGQRRGPPTAASWTCTSWLIRIEQHVAASNANSDQP
jgi:hypothetical protein